MEITPTSSRAAMWGLIDGPPRQRLAESFNWTSAFFLSTRKTGCWFRGKLKDMQTRACLNASNCHVHQKIIPQRSIYQNDSKWSETSHFRQPNLRLPAKLDAVSPKAKIVFLAAKLRGCHLRWMRSKGWKQEPPQLGDNEPKSLRVKCRATVLEKILTASSLKDGQAS